MTASERNEKINYLKSYRWISAEIENDEERLARLDTRLYTPGAVKLTDMPKGGQAVTMESLVAEKLELQERINSKCAELREIAQAIERVPSARGRLILKYRFVDDLTHEEIAERINYSTAQTRRYYEAALELFER